MTVKMTFNLGDLGFCDIITNIDHGNPDEVYVDGEDYSHDGPVVDVLMRLIGERAYQDKLMAAQRIASTIDDCTLAKSQAELRMELDGAW